MLGDRRQQPLVVGIATDHPVQYDHVGRRDAVLTSCDVADSCRSARSSSPASSSSLCASSSYAAEKLEAYGVRRTVLEQFEMDLADAASDLEDGRTLDAVLLEERDHLPGGLVDAARAVSPRNTPGEAGVEELVAAAGVAAVHCDEPTPASTVRPGNGSSNGSRISRRPRAGQRPSTCAPPCARRPAAAVREAARGHRFRQLLDDPIACGVHDGLDQRGLVEAGGRGEPGGRLPARVHVVSPVR